MTEAYRNRFIAFHADTVARTATLDASKLGQNLAWRGAIDSGAVDETSVLKRWVGVKDDREREEHLEMEGETVAFNDQFSNGEDIPGESTYNCRCIPYYYSDPEAARRVALTGDAYGDTADRASGIIGTIQGFLENSAGGTIDEIMSQLKTDFPERNPDGMKQTVKTQLNRLAKTTGREVERLDIEGRGKVFRFKVPEAPPPVPPGPPTPPPVPPPGTGVVGTIKWFLERPEGGTIEEIMNQLRKDFPERNPAGMLQTVKTQLNRLPKSLGRELEKPLVPGRGRVFRFANAGGIENPKPLPTYVEPKVKPPTAIETAVKKLASMSAMTDDQMEAAGLEEFIGENNNYIKPPFAGNGQHIEQILSELQSDSYSRLYDKAMEMKTEAQLRKIALSSDLRTTQGSLDRGIVEKYIRAPSTNKLPPLVVRYNGQDWIVDGHHRLTADMLLGKGTAEVRYIDLDNGMSALKDGKRLDEAAALATKGEPKLPAYVQERAKLSEESFQQNERSRTLWKGLSEKEREFMSQRGYAYAETAQKNYGTFFPQGARKGLGRKFKDLGSRPNVTVRKELATYNPTRAMGTAAHEMGHGLDYAYGWKGDVWGGNFDGNFSGKYWSDNSKEFQEALKADLALKKAVLYGEDYQRKQYVDWINTAYKRGKYGPGVNGLSREMLLEQSADMISAIRYGESIRGRWTASQFIDMFPNTAAVVRQRFVTNKL
jgi:hypothetical protein